MKDVSSELIQELTDVNASYHEDAIAYVNSAARTKELREAMQDSQLTLNAVVDRIVGRPGETPLLNSRE